MKKMMAVTVLASMCLGACGGGSGSSGNSQPTAKAMTISMYGNPLVPSSSAAVSHVQVLADSVPASSPAVGASDAQTTVRTLQEALAARGVTATVTAQVMDGTTLHQIVMGENNGLPPTQDQFKTDPSAYLIVNFQLDDMVSRIDDPTQAAAIQQFIQDLTVFAQRATVSGKIVLAVAPIPTCDQPAAQSAAYGLQYAISQASLRSLIQSVGSVPITIGFDGLGNVVQTPELAHLGADCRTPDAYLLNARTDSIADRVAAIYKESAPSSASGASATGK